MFAHIDEGCDDADAGSQLSNYSSDTVIKSFYVSVIIGSGLP
jgi:hypothetical protein